MAERLGETTQDQQREVLSSIETSGGYQPPVMATSYSPVVEIQKHVENVVSPAAKNKTGTKVLIKMIRRKNH